MAVSCCSTILQSDPDATLGLLPYVLPVLVERLQCDEVGGGSWHSVACGNRHTVQRSVQQVLLSLKTSTVPSNGTAMLRATIFAVLQSHNPTEPSEEVRLKLVELLSMIMEQAGTAIAAYASEVWAMLTAILVDSFHEVAVLGCQVSQQLAGGHDGSGNSMQPVH